jgi:uncharacterized repeat protein (TIGR02543 family)
MKIKSRKLLSTLLALAMAFSLFAAMPMAASSAGAPENAAHIANTINSFGHGGIGTLTATVSSDNTTVTVTGAVTAVNHTLKLKLSSDVTVVWKAAYSTLDSSYLPDIWKDYWFDTLLILEGNGKFQVDAGGAIIDDGKGAAIQIDGRMIEVIINGGTVRAAGKYHAIHIGQRGAAVSIMSGLVETTGSGSAIYAPESTAAINVSGGTVNGTGAGSSATTIYAGGMSSVVNVSGGTVSGADGAIRIDGGNSAINVSGGIVSSGDITPNTITPVSGIGVISSAGGNSKITVSGGIVHGEGHRFAIYDQSGNAQITVSGGVVSSDMSVAIWVVRGGEPPSAVTVSGGFVFGYGREDVYATDNTDGAAIMIWGGPPPAITGRGVVCLWDRQKWVRTYTAGTSEHLLAAPSGASVMWGKNGSQSGIYYSNGSNNGFFPFAEVTVSDANIVTFFSSGATYATQPVISGEKAVKPADPTRIGFIFGGWFTDSSLTTAYDFNNPVTADMTLYAKWTTNAIFMQNFVKINKYILNIFADVNENLWYGFNQQKVIASAYEYGLMKGNSDTTFNPTGNMTIAEAITVAARVHSIYTTGTDNFTQGSPWYQVYVDYAIANGIITATDFSNYAAAATRAQMAHIFSRALPAAEFASQNTVNSLPDVNSGTPYYSAIITLYKAGVVGGSDSIGTFNPNSNITRAEAAAIISRVILPATRISGKTY